MGITKAALAAAKRAREMAKKKGVGVPATATPGRMSNQIMQQGGYTVDPVTGDIPTTGLMMGKYENEALFPSGPFAGQPRTSVIPESEFKRSDVADFYGRHADMLTKPKTADNPEQLYAGGWRSGDNGNVYLDISRRFEPEQLRHATKYGEKTGQLAGYNVGTGQEFPVGNWQEFIESPEFVDRLTQMSKRGKDYLKQHPTDEWWDMHGTALEDVYGSENLDKMAGFIASTAPNTPPDKNLRDASEYMRRLIAGEPIIQPDYRIPETARTRTPGVKIGMEAGRVANLEKSAAGDIDRLQSDKVRSEAQALMGDPDAVVLDRWWARLAEDPKSGVYTGTQEGKFPVATKTNNPYAALEDVIRRRAGELGETPRNFSADVWTGVRETVKDTDDLFGQPFKGSSVPGESKGYADIFMDEAKKKAQHLGLSLSEFLDRLRKGRAELLGVGAAPLPMFMGTEREDY